MNQSLSSKIWLFKWATFRHDVQNVTMIFFFSLDLTPLFRRQCRMKIRTPYNTNIIMDKKSFFRFEYSIMTSKDIFAKQDSY